jgi:hypothetical protein
VRDQNGELLTVRYEAVNAMLLNEFLKEHRKNEQQEETITQLKSSAARNKLRRAAARGNQSSPAGQRAGRANSESERASPTQQTFVANRFSTTRNRRYKLNESNRQKIRKNRRENR